VGSRLIQPDIQITASKTPTEFALEMIQDLERQGIYLALNDRNLVARGPKQGLTPEVVSRIRKHKQKLIKVLRGSSAVGFEGAIGDLQRALYDVERKADFADLETSERIASAIASRSADLCAAVVHGDRGQLAVLLCELSDRVGAISCGVDAY